MSIPFMDGNKDVVIIGANKLGVASGILDALTTINHNFHIKRRKDSSGVMDSFVITTDIPLTVGEHDKFVEVARAVAWFYS